MAITFDQLPARLTRLGREFEAGATAIMRFAAKAGDEAVVKGTPADVGTARSNFVGTLDRPFSGVIPAYSPGKNLGLGEGSNAAAAIAQANTAIDRFDITRNRAIFIANNLSYIGRLNSGSSTQAPAGFVQLAVVAAVARVKSIKSVIIQRSA